jgi:hypothetical protein
LELYKTMNNEEIQQALNLLEDLFTSLPDGVVYSGRYEGLEYDYKQVKENLEALLD